MVYKYSDLFRVSHQDLVKEGAFDAFLDIDSRLYVDPHLLVDVETPELVNSYNTFTSHFTDVMSLIRLSDSNNNALYRQAIKKLTFSELPNVSLGYSKSSSYGNGIGPKIAAQLALTASQIIHAGIVDPTIFELVGLIEQNVGADRISDMTISIILPDLLLFSQRVVKNLQIQSLEYKHENVNYKLPCNPSSDQPIILIPQTILRDLPVAYDWSDIDIVCSHNVTLRRSVNNTIGNTWKSATSRRIKKSELRNILLQNPDIFQDLITQYKGKCGTPYDYKTDPSSLFKWENIARDYSSLYPLSLELRANASSDDVMQLVLLICNHFKRLIENNGLNALLYDENRKLRPEKFAQLLFFGIADSYCTANNLDLSREPNAGRGPLDFKMSRGALAKVSVEVKYSTNSHLGLGFDSQLLIYNRAEQSQHSVYLIIQTFWNHRNIDEIIKNRLTRLQNGEKVPEIIVIDGQFHPSASRRQNQY